MSVESRSDASIRVASERPGRTVSLVATMHRVRRAVRYANDEAALEVLSAALDSFAAGRETEDLARRSDEAAAGRPAA